MRQFVAFEKDFPCCLMVQTDQSFSEGRLSRAALSDQSDDFLRVHVQADAVNRVYDSFRVKTEMLRDALCFNQRLHTASPRYTSCTSCREPEWWSQQCE